MKISYMHTFIHDRKSKARLRRGHVLLFFFVFVLRYLNLN